MAFRWREFVRGALAACITFNLLFLIVVTLILTIMSRSLQSVLSIVLMVGWFQVVFVVAASVLATVIGGPIAFALGRLLRTTESMRRHVLVFAGLGLLVGGAVIAIVGFWSADENAGFGSVLSTVTEPYIALPLLAVSAISVAYGWYWTASRALSDDPVPQVTLAEAQRTD